MNTSTEQSPVATGDGLAGKKTVGLTMAKASIDEWQACMDFANKLEEEIKYSEMSDAELGAWVRKAPCLFRVVFGYYVLVDNCCDPNSDTLQFKPSIAAAIAACPANK